MLLDNSEQIKRAFFGPDEGVSSEPTISYEETRPPKKLPWPSNKRRPSRRYMSKRDPLPRCIHCTSMDLIRDDKHGDTVCTECATCHTEALTNDAFKCMAYDDFGKLKSYQDALQKRNCYKKSNYFADMLKYLSAAQQLEVPPVVWDTIRNQDYMTVPVKASDIREVLKRRRFHRFYRHASLLARMVNRAEGNHVTPPLNHQEEDLLKYMFSRFCDVFAKIRGNRKNSLNYAYVMYQFLRLIDRDDLCDHVSMLKCKTRLRQHDSIWREFCEHSGWQYIPYLI